MKKKLKEDLEAALLKIKRLSNNGNKKTGFFIGNTVKIDQKGFYFMPIRETNIIVTSGTVVCDEKSAIEIAETIDGNVDYVLVDVEKKIPSNNPNELANIEKVVREKIIKSKIWVYKANDITVDAIDLLLVQLTKNDSRGMGGKKVAIIGSGNIGSKIALKLVERGARIFITRRDRKKLKLIAEAINLIKPLYTESKVKAIIDNEKAAMKADILIGTAPGVSVISRRMIKNISNEAIVIDVGKGTLDNEALELAEERKIPIYRLDVTAAIEGLLTSLHSSEYIQEKIIGRRKINGINVVSGGLFARRNEIVLDNVWNPKHIYGISNGSGDFEQKITKEQNLLINKLKASLKI